MRWPLVNELFFATLPRNEPMSDLFDDRYPNIARLLREDRGWIEIGYDDYRRSFIRVLDLGGMIWESDKTYSSIDQALIDADQATADWFATNY